MTSREPKSCRVDAELWERFEEYVASAENGIGRGDKPKHLEAALREYMDDDRLGRLESKVDRLVAAVDTGDTPTPDESGGHTHTSVSNDGTSRTVLRCREIASRLQANHDVPVVKWSAVKRAIEDIAGGHPQTLDKYTTMLKERELLFEHPAQDSSAWTHDRDQWLEWVHYYLESPGTHESDFDHEYGYEDEQIANEATAVMQQ